MANKPGMVTYFNNNTQPLSTITKTKYTDVVLAFALPENPDSTTLKITGNLPQGDQLKSDIKTLQDADIQVHLSIGGEYDEQHREINYALLAKNIDSVADQLAAFVSEFGLDGVDIDYEDTVPLTTGAPYDGVAFATDLTNSLRKALDKGKIISHAPQVPYLWKGTDSPYAKILANTGDAIDRLYIQYYNNPWYVDPVTQIVDNVNDIVAGWDGFDGIDASRVYVGKPVAEVDAGSGWISATDIGEQVLKPLLEKHSNLGGVMGWQYSSDGPDGDWTKTLPGYLWP